MKIDSVKIKNFRGYADETQILFNDLTVFVGKNDIGKSTILEALDIFFNDGKGVTKIDKSDVNVKLNNEGNQDIEITVIFSELPEKIVIDSSVETTLENEYLLNENHLLEIKKKYNNGGTAKVFIKALHPTNENCSNLLLKKNSELKKIVKDGGIECENQTINSALRRAIWINYKDTLDLETVEIDASKDDVKKIWEKISPYMPSYSLFQSDRKNSDGDSEVQDPLREAVKQILANAELQKTLSDVASIVHEKLQEVSDRTLDKLKEMDPDIADSLKPIIPTPESLKWQDVFKSVSISGDDNIPINKRGSGVKRLILLNFFRGEVQRRFEEGNSTGVIYAIEEPETSQHTDNQRKLIEALKDLSRTKHVQVILTTHSPEIVKQLEFSNLRLITEKNGEKNIDNVLPGQLQYPSLNEVNYVAFNEATEEYHNELYGYIEFQGWKQDYFKGRATRKYIRQSQNGSKKEEEKDLTEYIRHQIHHPENKLNPHYTHEELRHSINDMRNFIQQKMKTQSNQEYQEG